MASPNFLLNVHTCMDVVRKMTLSSNPESVYMLKTMMNERKVQV